MNKIIGLIFCGLISVSINAQENKMNMEYNLNFRLSELEERTHFLIPLQQEEIVNYVSSSIFPVSSSVILIDNQQIHTEITNQQLDNKSYITLKFTYNDNEKKQLNVLITVHHYQQQNSLKNSYDNARKEFFTSIDNYSISPLPFAFFDIKTTGVRFIGSHVNIYWVYKNSFVSVNGNNTLTEKQIRDICNWIQAQLEDNLIIQ